MGTVRESLVEELRRALGSDAAYTVSASSDTDITVASNPVHPQWGCGQGRADYRALLKVVEHDRTIHFWESTTGHGATSLCHRWGERQVRAVVSEIAARHGFGVSSVLNRDFARW